MNAVSFGLPMAAYFNLDAAGSNTWLDWVVGVAGEIFIDQKTMALFSLLFGAGIVVFADRAQSKTRRPGMLILWRNLLLLVIGLLHALLWDGDVLRVYALCAPVLVVARRASPRVLLVAGTSLVVASAALAVLVQQSVPADGDGLGDFWFADAEPVGDTVGVYLLSDFFLRALGMMLIGVALLRTGVLAGTHPPETYRRMTTLGFAVGLPLTIAGVILQAADDFSPSVSVIGLAPNHLATIPLALAYLGIITRWDQRPTTIWHERVRAVGRMALTNYLTQTIIGVAVLRWLVDDDDLNRSWIALFVVAVWVVQLAWSRPWLERFRFGPFEWLWRIATYRRWEPLLRSS